MSLVERPPLSLVQASSICLPLAGVSTSIWWDFIPMEVRANHLPICTCPGGRGPAATTSTPSMGS
jgi:hypothetical protein